MLLFFLKIATSFLWCLCFFMHQYRRENILNVLFICVKTSQRLPAFHLFAPGSSKMLPWTGSTTQWQCVAKTLKRENKIVGAGRKYQKPSISFLWNELEKRCFQSGDVTRSLQSPWLIAWSSFSFLLVFLWSFHAILIYCCCHMFKKFFVWWLVVLIPETDQVRTLWAFPGQVLPTPPLQHILLPSVCRKTVVKDQT